MIPKKLKKFRKIGQEAPGALECNLTGRCSFFKNLHNPLRKKFAFQYPVSELLDYKNSKNNRENNSLLFLKTIAIGLEQIVITCFRISDQFSYSVQEFMLKNDALKNGTSRIGLCGSAPRTRG